MTIDTFLQLSGNGLLLGAVYAGLGVGLSLLLGVLKIVNLSHSAVLIFGALIYWELVNTLGLDPILAVLPVAAFGYFFGLLLHRTVAQYLAREDMRTMVLAFFGVLVLVESVAIMIWSTDTKTVSLGYLAQTITLGPISVSLGKIVAALLTVLVMVAMHLYLTRTVTGSAVRAISQNLDVAQMVGIKVNSLARQVFGAGLALAAFGGAALAMVISFTPQEHPRWLAWAFLVVILGGLGSSLRTLVAGLVVGVIESFVGFLLPFAFTYVILYGLLAVMLLVRTEGLGGVKQREL